MRDGKETIQVRRKHRGSEKVMEEEKMKENWRNMYFLCSQGGWSKIKLTTLIMCTMARNTEQKFPCPKHKIITDAIGLSGPEQH